MKVDASDNLIGVQAPLRKQTQKRSRAPRAKKEEGASDSEPEVRSLTNEIAVLLYYAVNLETCVLQAEAPRKPAKKAAQKKRVRVVNGADDEDNAAAEDVRALLLAASAKDLGFLSQSDEYLPQ